MFESMRRTGQDIHLDIEPEPDGLVETTEEFIRFFERVLHTGAPLLANSAQLSRMQAEDALRQHIAFCYDLCHSTVEYEDSQTVIDSLRKAGVRIGRVQVSSAIKIAIPSQSPERELLGEYLSAFADPVYLHQIIGNCERYADLPEALDRLKDTPSTEWRIHYHVPLFMASYGKVDSTQAEVKEALLELRADEVRHLEIETYTWSVLPSHQRLEIVDSIEREYRWVVAQLCTGQSSLM
jgi:hypothetical protein